MALARFLSSPAGRIIRIATGIIIILVGLFVVNGNLSITLAALGVVPLMAGLIGLCIFALIIRTRPKEAGCS